MNCCNDFGACTGGHNCPVRATPEPGHQQDTRTPFDELGYWVAIFLASAATTLATAGFAGYLYMTFFY